MTAIQIPIYPMSLAESCAVTKVSVVIPVYRSAASLRSLYEGLNSVLNQEHFDFEILFVDDSGEDEESWAVIHSLAEGDRRVRGLRLSRNFGQHAATMCGFAHTSGEWVVTLDDDLEHDPQMLPRLLQKANEGYDLVYGVYPDRTHKKWRNYTSKIVRFMFKKAIPSLNDQYTSYRVIRGAVARELAKFDSPFPFVDGYLSWMTRHYAYVEVQHGLRGHGASNYTFKTLLVHAVNVFVTFSDLPLRVATWIGLITFIFGVIWATTIVLGYLLGGIGVSGFASIMVAILVFGGIQLLVLGIFGEYLGRMNFRLSRMPLFIVSRVTEAQIDTKNASIKNE